MSKANQALAQRILDRLEVEHRWSRILIHEDNAAANMPGAANYGAGSGRTEREVIESVLDGHEWPEFDPTGVQQARSLAAELDLKFSCDERFPYLVQVEDPYDWAYGRARLALYFNPSGVLIGAHGKHGIDRRNREGDPEVGRQMLVAALLSLRVGRALQLSQIDRHLKELNALRAVRGAEPMTLEEYRRNH